VAELVSAGGLLYYGHFWVFFGALRDVAYTITVTDTVEGRQRTYRNTAGSQCGLPDTEAF
jgi:hypothetical protein